MRHYRVELTIASCPTGAAGASIRDCLCCGVVLCAMGGGAKYLCEKCLDMMESDEMMRILSKAVELDKEL